jgi:outer membrane protein
MQARTLCLLPSLTFALALCAIDASAQSAPAPSAPSAPPADAPQGANEELSFDLEKALVSSERGMTSDEAGTRARDRSPQIASAKASAEAAHWDAKSQWSNFLPQVSASAQYKRIKRIELQLFDPDEVGGIVPPQFEDSADFTAPVNNYSIAATARIPVSDLFLRVLPSYKGALSIADARAVEVETRRASVELQAREAFYGYARALATQIVAEQALKQAEAQAAQAKLFVDAGTVAPVDLMTATARAEAMRSALARARGAVAIGRDRVATLTGVPTSEVAEIREPVTRLPEAPTDSLENLLGRARDQRPELRALRKLVDANGQLKKSERNAALPTLSVDGNVIYGRPNPRYIPPNDDFRTSWEVGATLAWSPNGAVIGYQRAQRAGAEIERARADLLALEDSVRMELVQAYEDYKAADAAARASEAQQKAAEETYRVRSATYRVGAGVQIDLLTADFALTQARLDYVNAVLDARIALARLRRAVGG